MVDRRRHDDSSAASFARRLRLALAGALALLAAAIAIPLALAGTTEPSGGRVVLVGERFLCRGPVDLDLVKVTAPGGGSDAVVLGEGCTGRIGRIEAEGPMADGIKVQNAGAVARDLVVEGGYVRCGEPAPGVHQDGVQAMGGYRITFRRLVIDCLGGGGGNFFVARGGSGASTPTEIVCERCALGPRHPNQVQAPAGAHVASGVRDSLVCRPASGRTPFMGTPVNAGNTLAEPDDPRCAFQGLLAAVAGGGPGPEPPPAVGCDLACVQRYEEQIADLRAEVERLRSAIEAALSLLQRTA